MRRHHRIGMLLLFTVAARAKKPSAGGGAVPVPAAPTSDAVDEWYETALGGKGGKALLQRLKDGVAAVPGEPKLHAALGLATLSLKGKEKEGVKHLRDALALNPGFEGLHQRLALQLQERTPADRWARNEAVQLYRTGLRLNPRDDDCYFRMGQLQAQLDGKDRMGKALPTFDAKAWAKQLGAETDEVAVLWRDALRLNPAHTDAHNAMSGRLLQSSSKKRRKKAAEHARSAIELAPSHAWGYRALASAVLRADAQIDEHPMSVENASALTVETRDDALEALRSSVKLPRPPKTKKAWHADSYYELGLMLLTARRGEEAVYREALDFFRAALKLRPKDQAYQIAEKNCADHVHKIVTGQT